MSELSTYSNIDLLAWFDEEEREECAHCGERAAVGFREIETIFCLACGAVWLRGKRLDDNFKVAVEDP